MKSLEKSSVFPGVSTLFNDFFEDNRMMNLDWANGWSKMPSANVIEDDKEFKIELAAPGMKKNDFKVDIVNNKLTISSEMNDEKEEVNENYTRKEFSYNSFSRSFILPESVEVDKIEATYNDGILKLDLPKKPEVAKLTKKAIAVH
ncbi:Hsp20/alpha crystallin family protein [Fulvivirga lutimaris]|uniref:Hsp20/alpha crystallin family protein n=1 Tax=Fulvivirga lutimaris TaxID=1819566 RepID=UPI0012BB57CB|nr:Hsp20/alpha crystallin family protein [Fulvivirga lutimaris]MTI38921.1 Hsp20/alpha crystallin family protein [Fulvivirga lutimaris]